MNFLHSGSMGDVIYSIATIRALIHNEQRRTKIIDHYATLYLKPDVYDTIPSWAGVRATVRMTRANVEFLLPLFKGLNGFEGAAVYDNQHIDYNLDAFRNTGFDFTRGHIGRYYAYAYAIKPCLYNTFLVVQPSDKFKDCILVNRTQRYHNPRISYKVLSNRTNVFFVGYREEYAAFVKDCPGVPYAGAPADALELAQWIRGCKLFVGNQSFCFSLAEAMKSPRVLEVFTQCPNVIPQGSNGWDAIANPLWEEIIKTEAGFPA